MSKIWKAKADAIAKRCPNGYHKDENGNCVDSNGNYYQRKQEQPKQEQPKQTEIPSNFDPSKLSEKEKKKIFSSHKSYRGKAYNALSNLYTALNIANSKNDKEYDEFRNEIAHTNPENICDNYEKYVSRWNKINSNSKYDSEFKRGMNETKYSPLEYLKSIKQYVENERKYSKLSHLILDYEQSKRKNAGKSTNKSKSMKKGLSWIEPDPIYHKMWEKFVPSTGKADTDFGETLRCTSRVIYRFYNDGDKYNVGYGRETVNPALDWLADSCPYGNVSQVAQELRQFMNDNVQHYDAFENRYGEIEEPEEDYFDASEEDYQDFLIDLDEAVTDICYQKEREMNSEAEDRSYYASTKKSKMKKNFDPSLNTMYEVQHTDYDVPDYATTPNVGDVFINPNGVELKITNISLTSDGTPQIAYNNSSKGYEECYDLERFRNILHAGYFAKKSTKKSYTPDYQDFRSMVKSIKNTGNHNNVFKE